MTKKTLKQILVLLKPYKYQVIMVMIMSGINAFASDSLWTIIIRSMSNALDSSLISAVEKYRAVGRAGIALLICIVVQNVGMYARDVYMSNVVTNIRVNNAKALFNTYMKLSYSYYDETKVGEITNVMTEDIERIGGLVWYLAVRIASILTGLIAGCIVLYTINPLGIAITLPASLLLLLYETLMSKKLKKSEEETRATKRKLSVFYEDIFSGIRTVIAYAQTEEESTKHDQLSADFAKARHKKYVSRWVLNMGSNTIVCLTFTLVLVIGGIFVIQGRMTMTDLLITYNFLWAIINPIFGLTDFMDEISTASVGLDAINNVLSLESDIVDNGKYISEVSGDITFRRVSFSYKDNGPETIQLQKLIIKEGEFTGIVGKSGAGKSTIAQLIPRLYDVNYGSIKIGNVDIKDFDLAYLRSQIGIIQQDTYLFNGSVADNISYGNRNVTIEDIMKAAKAANIHEFISSLPDGYQTDVGERGIKLSGGQKQRVAIARCFLSNPKILILDEATSALDNESEREVQKSIEELAKNRTVIAIAHRLSTVQNADKIYVFGDKGRIEESGTHDDLMELKGQYYQMYNLTQKE